MEVICIRHGEAESNIRPPSEGIVGSDHGLTDRGRKQSIAAAHNIAKLVLDGRIGPVPTTIYSSPYVRTRQTAEIIAKELDGMSTETHEVVVDYRLKEIQKGDWHGMTVADVLPLEAAIPSHERPYFNPPEEHVDAENWLEVGERMVEFIHEMEREGIKQIVLVSHDHPIDCMFGKLLGRPVYEWEDYQVTNGSISRIVHTEDGWTLSDDKIYNYRGEKHP